MTAISPLSGATPPATDRAGLDKAAKGFEAIFVRQMLAAARQTHFGDTLLGSEAMDTFRQMQDERMADLAADAGAFGIGRMIAARLATQVEPG